MSNLAHQQAARDLAVKLRYEVMLARRMRSLFKTIAADAKQQYKVTGDIPKIGEDYRLETEAILREHGRKVAKQFKHRLRETIKKSFMPGIYEIKATPILEKAIRDYIIFRARLSGEQISKTTEKELNEAFINNTFGGNRRTRDELAEEAAFEFERRALGRTKTIGLTETQNIAESVKNLEATYFFQEDELVAGGVVLGPERMTKTWTAILDTVTRDAHVEADDQTVSQIDPFIVMGEQLMYPGDESMGASKANICNCRCNSSRAIDLSGLPDYVLRPDVDL